MHINSWRTSSAHSPPAIPLPTTHAEDEPGAGSVELMHAHGPPPSRRVCPALQPLPLRQCGSVCGRLEAPSSPVCACKSPNPENNIFCLNCHPNLIPAMPPAHAWPSVHPLAFSPLLPLSFPVRGSRPATLASANCPPPAFVAYPLFNEPFVYRWDPTPPSPMIFVHGPCRQCALLGQLVR